MDASPAPLPRRMRPAGGRPLPSTPKLAIPARSPSPGAAQPPHPQDHPITPTPVRHPSLGLQTVTQTHPPDGSLAVPSLVIPRAPSRSGTPNLSLNIGVIGTPANGSLHPHSQVGSDDDDGSMYNLVGSGTYNTPTLRPAFGTATSSSSAPETGSSVASTATTASTVDFLREEMERLRAQSDSEGDDSEGEDHMNVEWTDNDFVKISRLGEGAGGSVDKVKEKATGRLMARKTIPTQSAPEQQLRRELQLLGKCKHEHIVVFYGAYLSARDSLINLVMEYCEGGSLEAVSHRMRKDLDNAVVGEKVIAKIAEGVLKGLVYLHSNKIIHRDIKPSNILLTRTGVVKLIDFGVSGELVNSLAGTFTGTSYYMAPERISGAKYTIRSDVWSLGLTLLELTRSDPIYPPDLGPIELLQYIRDAQPPRLEDDAVSGTTWSNEMKDFIKECLTLSPTARPSPEQMLEHPWMLQSGKRKIALDKWIAQVWGWPGTAPKP